MASGKISSDFMLQEAVIVDNPPIGQKFGQVLTDVENTAYHAGETVTAQFVGANPRVSGRHY
jgi:neutral ceramidase